MAEFSAGCRPVRGKVCVLVTSGGRFNIRRRSLALAGPQISAKNRRGVRLFGTVHLFKRIRYSGREKGREALCLWCPLWPHKQHLLNVCSSRARHGSSILNKISNIPSNIFEKRFE